MNAALGFRRMAIALVLLSVAAFAASERSAWTLVVGGVLALAATSVTYVPSRLSLPPWLLRLGVIAAIAWGSWSFLSQPSADEAPRIVGNVVLGVLLLKLWDRKSPSDWRQVVALSIVLVVAAALLSVDFLVGVLVVAYAMAIVAATMLYHLYAGAERVTG